MKNIYKIFLILLLICSHSTQVQAQFSPDSISSLMLWLNADLVHLNGSNIDTCYDQSGNNNYAFQTNISNQPLFVDSIINNYPIIRFDGNDDKLNGTIISKIDSSSFSIFIVSSGAETTSETIEAIFSINNYTNGFWITRRTYTAEQILRTFCNGLNYISTSVNSFPNSGYLPRIISHIKELNVISKLYINGFEKGSSTNGNYNSPFTNNNYSIGKTGFGFKALKGDIAEIIIYDTVLTNSLRELVENYLYNKYAPPVNLGPDINIAYGFCDTVLDAGSRFVSYKWSTGTNDTLQTVAVNKSGTYYVTATNIFEQESYDTVEVIYPVINTINNTNICLEDTILWNTNLSNDYNFLWQDSSVDSVIKIFSAGDYYVKVTDSLSCYIYSDTITATIDSFSYYAWLGHDTSFCSGNYIKLMDFPLSFDTALYNNLTYLWSDSSTDSILIIDTSGTYSVTVTNTDGCIKIDSIDVTITGIAPNALFKTDTVCLGDSTHFTDLSTFTSPYNIISWFWDFDDGETSDLQNPVHKYNNFGNFSVILTDTSFGNCFNSITKTVIVNEPPTAYFDVSTACINEPYQFIDQSYPAPGDSIISWFWDFDDGDTSILQNPQHIYLDTGTYNVSLNISTYKGCQSSSNSVLNVVDSANSPEQFTLVYPDSNFVTPDTVITFVWNISINANYYLLQIATDSLFNNIIYSQTTDSNNEQLSIINYQLLFWRVIAFNICNDSIVSDIYKLLIFNPNEISGLQLWLNADSVHLNGNNIDTCYDQSGNNNYAFQTNSDNQPLFIDSIINNYPVIRFGGDDDKLDGTIISGIDSSSFSIFIVSSGAATTSETIEAIFSINNYTNGFWIIRRAYTSEQILRVQCNGMNSISTSVNSFSNSGYLPRIISHIKELDVISKLYINGFEKGSSTNSNYNNPFTNNNYSIGHTDFGFKALKGDIAEIIIYNTALDSTERCNVEQYLFYKYAPPVNLGPDINIAYGVCPVVLDAGERFVSYQWSTGTNDTLQTTEVNNSGTYWVSVENIFGQISSDTIVITKPGVHLNDTAMCLNDSITINTGLGQGYTFCWSNSTDTLSTDSSFTFSQQDEYFVLVSDTLGCSVSDTFFVAIDSFEVKAGLGPDTSICSGEYIGLTSCAEQAVSYFWSDGSSDSTLLIENAGTYSVTVTNNIGCVAVDTINLTIKGYLPVVNFTADTVCLGDTTYFTDSSSSADASSLYLWEWDFDDETSVDSNQNPAHRYSEYGIYNVSLSVTTSVGCKKTIAKDAYVYSLPKVKFAPTNGCSGVSVQFTDQTTNEFGGIGGWQWDFYDPGSGTDNFSTSQNPSHTFYTPGTYPVKLIVTSQKGCVDSIVKNVNINEAPVVGFSYTTGCFGTPVSFSDTTYTPPWTQIKEWLWTFGDGDSAYISNPTHLFDSAGTYNVTLKVKSLNGCSPSHTEQVKVYALPEVDFFSSNLFCENTFYEFLDNSSVDSSSIAQWTWKFDGQDISYEQNPVLSFSDTGAHYITLIVESAEGCIGSTVKSIDIFVKPDAEFSFTPEFGTPPLEVTFSNETNGATSYSWDFGDDNFSSDFNPVHTYIDSRIYNISLVAFNDFGCTDTAYHPIYVVIPIIDIAVLKAYAEINDNYLSFSADLENFGTCNINEINMIAKINGGTALCEKWQGMLEPGNTMNYQFNAQFKLSPEQTIDYICISASMSAPYNDINLSNNEQCVTFNNEFTAIEPYPNPTNKELIIEYILPFDDNVDIILYDSKGAKVCIIYSGEGKTGLNRQIIDFSALSIGIYAYRIIFRDKSVVKKFVRF